MRQRYFLLLSILLIVGSPAAIQAGWNDWAKQLGGVLQPGGSQDSAAGLSQADIAAGLREALGVGVERAIALLGRDGGFLNDAQVRIPMPGALQTVEKGLRAAGQGAIADEFVQTINHAAEQAAPEARAIFVDAIRSMTLEDAGKILNGPDDAATRYFRERSEARLAAAVRPVVERATARVGVTSSYKRMVGGLGPLARLAVPGGLDLDRYVTQKTVDGIFIKLAEEEKRIRKDPMARSTELLKQVFGG